MHKKNKSCEPTHSQDGILGLEQLLYEVSYRRKILCEAMFKIFCKRTNCDAQ